MARSSISSGRLVYVEGSPCSKRRYGCVGRVRATLVKHRDGDGVLSERRSLVCDHCGQAHGPAPAEPEPAKRVVCAWYDSDLPSQRTRALQLWSDGDLFYTVRPTGSDVWGPPHLLDSGVSYRDAGVIGGRLELEPYLP